MGFSYDISTPFYRKKLQVRAIFLNVNFFSSIVKLTFLPFVYRSMNFTTNINLYNCQYKQNAEQFNHPKEFLTTHPL
jgi:hypothetical protein